MNASAAEENVKSRDDKGSGNNGQTKKIKRKAWFVVCQNICPIRNWNKNVFKLQK